jgi:RNA polymerase sigma-70 factor, ECF subfamily
MASDLFTPTTAPPSQSDFARRIELEIPFLRRLVRRWQRAAADADDLVQDTLVRALASEHSWQAGSNLRAWLITIMRNQFLAGLAKSGRSAEAHESFGAAGPETAAHAGEARLLLRDVQQTLRRMPRKQRAAILLVSVEGRSYQEVAHALGASVGAVRSDLARARERLRAAVLCGRFDSPLAERIERSPAVAAFAEPPPHPALTIED